MTPPKYFPPPPIFLNPVVDPVLVANKISNINTIHIVVIIIIDVQSQKCISRVELVTVSDTE